MTQKERRLLIVMTVGLTLLLILRDVMGIGISKFIYLGYTVVFMAIAQYQTLVCMICFMMPLVCGLPGTYIMPFALAFLIIKRGHVNAWQLGMIFFVAIMELIASLWYPASNFPAIVQYVSFAGVLFFLIHDKTELDYGFCVRIYLYGVCILCATIITTALATAPSNWLELFAQGYFRFGDTQSDYIEGMKLSLNANSLAYYSITGICCSIFAAEGAKVRKRLLFICLAIFCGIAGLLSLSRSWLLVAAICLLLYVFSKLRRPKQFISVAAVLAVIYVVTAWYFGKNPELLEGFLTRLNDETLETGGGRTEIFVAYMDVFMDDLRVFLMGAGVTQHVATLEMPYAMHNGPQQILVGCGAIGFFVYMVGLIKPILDARNVGRKPVAAWLPLIGLAIFAQVIQFLNPMMLMLPYAVCVFCLRTKTVK